MVVIIVVGSVLSVQFLVSHLGSHRFIEKQVVIYVMTDNIMSDSHLGENIN